MYIDHLGSRMVLYELSYRASVEAAVELMDEMPEQQREAMAVEVENPSFWNILHGRTAI